MPKYVTQYTLEDLPYVEANADIEVVMQPHNALVLITRISQALQEAMRGGLHDGNVRISLGGRLAELADESLEIVDVIADMPTHPTDKYARRSLDAIEGVVIHHVGIDDEVTPESIAQYCIDRRDWPGMPYHFYIRYDGTVLQCQSLNTVTYHCANVKGGYQCNTKNIGVAMEGSFVDGRVPKDEQIESCRRLNLDLLRRPGLVNLRLFRGHKEVRSTVCPGTTWDVWKPLVVPKLPD